MANQIAAPGSAAQAAGARHIPPVVKRNTILVASSQVCTGMATGLLPALGALMVYQMLGSSALAGAATVLQGITRFVVAYPYGVLADRHGRKPLIMAGLLAAALGAVVIGTSVALNSFPLLMAGVFVFAAASNGVQQLRVAATDMYPPSRRAEGLGYVLSGSVAGSLGQAGLISLASGIAVTLGVSGMALSWWLAPAVILPALLLVAQIRPDPRDIARNLAHYYPGYTEARSAASRPRGAAQPVGSFRAYLRDPAKRTIFLALFGVQGNMAMTMVITALTLAHHGHDLPAIGFSTTLHSLGMFAFTIPQGWLADRIGRKPVMLYGLLAALAGTVLIAFTEAYWTVTLGYFLVGFGWSAVYVAGTVLLADISLPEERARLIGSNDTFAGLANTLLAMIAGPVFELAGIHAIVIVGAALMAGPLLLVPGLRTVTSDG